MYFAEEGVQLRTGNAKGSDGRGGMGKAFTDTVNKWCNKIKMLAIHFH